MSQLGDRCWRKNEIHRLIRKLANQGTGIVLISSELPEIVGMCDRVVVMHEGRLSGVVVDEEINERRLYSWHQVYKIIYQGKGNIYVRYE